MIRSAAAFSQDEVHARAVGEVVGQIGDRLTAPPDMLMVFATPHHLDTMSQALSTIRTLLNPRVMVGCISNEVHGSGFVTAGRPGLSVLGIRFDQDVSAVRLETIPAHDSLLVTGGHQFNELEGTLILVGDLNTFSARALFASINEQTPDISIVGGFSDIVSVSKSPLLFLDEERFSDGAVGVWLPSSIRVVSKALDDFVPLGQPFVVTKAAKNAVFELAGRPALERFNGVLERLNDQEKQLLSHGVYLGRAIRESADEHTASEFVLTNVLGADRSIGAIAVDQELPIGETVQFHVHDHDRMQLGLNFQAAATLMFSSGHRGATVTGALEHLSGVVGELRHGAAGMVCAGQFARVNGVNHVHSVATAIAEFSQ